MDGLGRLQTPPLNSRHALMYSATVWTDPKLYAAHFGGQVDLNAFHESFRRRADGDRVSIPTEVDQAFLETQEPDFEPLRDLVIRHRLAQIRAADEEIASQVARLADARRRLGSQQTKGAGHSARMSTHKIAAARRRRASLAQNVDGCQLGRMFPGSFVPIVTVQDGKTLIRPMRYQCRPSNVERRMENLLESPHHARRDGLKGRWRTEFGHTHGVIAVESFFEAVALHRLRNRPLLKDESLAALELEFFPNPRQTLYVPCLWSHWQRPGRVNLLSFATIVDRAPAEVQAAGQDICPVVIKRENVIAWLNPDPDNLAASYAVLEDRPSVTFEHFPSSAERERLARPAPAKIINLWKTPAVNETLVA